MSWVIKYLPEVRDDLKSFDHSQISTIRKAIKKVQQNPLPVQESRYGKPLGKRNRRNLTSYQKIKLLREGIRSVYKAIKTDKQMLIIVIAAREDEAVYDIAEKRIRKHQL